MAESKFVKANEKIAEAEKRAAAHPTPAAPGGDIAKASMEASLERARSSAEASRNAGRHHA